MPLPTTASQLTSQRCTAAAEVRGSGPDRACALSIPRQVRQGKNAPTSTKLFIGNHPGIWEMGRTNWKAPITAAGSGVTTADRPYEALKGKEVYVASDQRLVDVTSLWGGDERCVLVFGRSMG
ncbi:unnamed protein product [Ostreobium quekettii]|uniref:Uncharacterized protein n=1 Tax=Ostreobium quekettii TaxID=121088 RepID=A0A8S1J9Y2_9CHLO|nr:unnamed protein product [Ostreobium quekettii]|eukprot:evm.model.scf_761.7 EVM.evm.TU.scf_761.7   scf_761:45888-46256(-)